MALREARRLGGEVMEDPFLSGKKDLSLSAVVEYLVGKPPTELRTAAEIMAAFEALGPRYNVFGPDLLYCLWRQRRLDVEVLRRLLLDVWRYTDFPTVGCPSQAWRAMFKSSGFLSDGIEKPKRRRVLYRGCRAAGRRGMSWSTERWVAEKFGDYWFDLGQADKPGHVYKAVVDPGCVLASIRGKLEKFRLPDGTEFEAPVRTEFEFIVDARSIPIVLVETAKERTARVQREEARVAARFAIAFKTASSA